MRTTLTLALPLSVLAALAWAVKPADAQFGSLPAAVAQVQPVYRLVSVSNGDHVYTTDRNEVQTVTLGGTHRLEGVSFYAGTRPAAGMVPLYRFITPDSRHFLSTNQQPAAAGIGQAEGLLGYISATPRQGLVPLYGYYQQATGLFFYTALPTVEQPEVLGYVRQGILGYVQYQ
jgi:hypothetical protein